MDKSKKMNADKLKHMTNYIIGIAVVMTVLLLSFVWITSSSLESTRLEFGKTQSFDKGWTYEDNGKRILAGAADRFGTTEVTLYNTIPESLTENRILYFKNYYRAVEVRLNGEMVYQFGVKSQPVRNHFLGNFYCFIPISAGGEQEISVRFLNTPDISTLQLWKPPFWIGSEGEVIYSLLRDDAGMILFSMIMAVFSIALIGFAVVESARKRDEDSNIFLFAGFFILIATIWVITDSSVLQFVYGNSEAVLNVSFLSFMLMVMPMLSFAEAVCGREVAGIHRLKIVFSVNFFIQCALYVGNVVSFMKMLRVTHMILLVAIVYLFVFMIKEYRYTGSRYAAGIVLAFMVFFAMTGVGLLAFYRQLSDYNGFFRFGLLTYSLILIWISIMKIAEGQEARAKASVYRFLAYTDAMTGLGNRMAFDQAIDTIDREQGTDKLVRMILMDLNGLKQVNDKYGHRAGDEIIIGMADCIREMFEGMGKCYRIGGDEFVVIIRGRAPKKETLIAELEKVLNTYNMKHVRKLSAAIGLSSMEDLREDKRNMSELYRAADYRMYRMKESMYQEMENQEKDGEH